MLWSASSVVSRYFGIGSLKPSEIHIPDPKISRAPKPRRAKLHDLRIDEPILVDGRLHYVNRLTYRDGICVAELRDVAGERVWVGDGKLYELGCRAGRRSFRLKRSQTVRRPEREAEYV